MSRGSQQDPWWRRLIIILGKEVSPLMLGGAIIGVLVCYFWLSKQPFWLDPLIGNAVRATIAAQPTLTPMPTCTPYTPILLTMGPTQTPTITPTPIIVIDTMDNTTGWDMYGNDKSFIVIGLADGQTNKAIEVSYAVREYGYVGIAKYLIHCQLFGTRGIRFSYKGSGALNTTEFKLIYAPNGQGKETVFSLVRNSSTDTKGQWLLVEALYSEFKCWPDTGCSADESLDISRVCKVDFAISNKPAEGDVPGTGVVLIDDIQAVR